MGAGGSSRRHTALPGPGWTLVTKNMHLLLPRPLSSVQGKSFITLRPPRAVTAQRAPPPWNHTPRKRHFCNRRSCKLCNCPSIASFFGNLPPPPGALRLPSRGSGAASSASHPSPHVGLTGVLLIQVTHSFNLEGHCFLQVCLFTFLVWCFCFTLKAFLVSNDWESASVTQGLWRDRCPSGCGGREAAELLTVTRMRPFPQ